MRLRHATLRSSSAGTPQVRDAERRSRSVQRRTWDGVSERSFLLETVCRRRRAVKAVLIVPFRTMCRRDACTTTP